MDDMTWINLILQKLKESCMFGKMNPRMTCIYVLELSNITVKIGKTVDIKRRIFSITSSSGLEILNYYHTAYVHPDVADKIEKACHQTFAGRQIKGEFFDVTFAEACAELDKYADEISEANRKWNEEILPSLKRDYDAYMASISQMDIKALPSPNAAAIFDAAGDTFSLKEKVEVLLRGAALTNLDRLRNQLIREAALIATGKSMV